MYLEEPLLIYRYKKTDPIKALHAVMVVIGLAFLLYTGLAICLIPTVLGVYLMVSDNALIVDLEHQRYKRNRLIGRWALGRWTALPHGCYLSVFTTTLVCTSHSITYRRIDVKERVVRVNLIHDKNRRLMLFQSNNADEAMSAAIRISHVLHLRIFDATGKVGVWVDSCLQH